jgi:hypothetical protein
MSPLCSPLFVRSFISFQAIKMNIYFGVMVVASCLIRLWLWLSIVLLVFRKMLIFRHRVSQARARSKAGLGTRPCTRSRSIPSEEAKDAYSKPQVLLVELR